MHSGKIAQAAGDGKIDMTLRAARELQKCPLFFFLEMAAVMNSFEPVNAENIGYKTLFWPRAICGTCGNDAV